MERKKDEVGIRENSNILEVGKERDVSKGIRKIY